MQLDTRLALAMAVSVAPLASCVTTAPAPLQLTTVAASIAPPPSPRAQVKTSTELLEVVLTDYVGNSNSEIASPEYISRIALRRDGSAVYIGNPTYARLKGRYEGRFEPAQFEKIAQLLPDAQKLTAGHEGPGMARTVLSFTRGDQEQSVTVYDDGAPSALRRMQGIASGLEWKISWKKSARLDRLSQSLSGVRGFAARGPLRSATMRGVPTEKSLVDGIVVLRSSSGREVARGRTDRAGQFAFSVRPGVYFASLIPPRSSGLRPSGDRQKIVVAAHGFSDVNFDTVAAGL